MHLKTQKIVLWLHQRASRIKPLKSLLLSGRSSSGRKLVAQYLLLALPSISLALPPFLQVCLAFGAELDDIALTSQVLVHETLTGAANPIPKTPNRRVGIVLRPTSVYLLISERYEAEYVISKKWKQWG